MRPVQIAPSVLPVDFSKLGEAVSALDAAGVDLIQWDVMDGQFVPNLTFGPDVIASTRHLTTKPFEAHLMVLTPDVMAKRYVEAGCQRLIVHAEACDHLHRTLGNIRELGATAAVALNPSTPPDEIANVLDLVDLVLVMTVNPGFGGQSYIKTMEPKIRVVRDMINHAGFSDTVDLEVDGGISPTTIEGAEARVPTC
jgi:ribulose-phosphate 3-epimerase